MPQMIDYQGKLLRIKPTDRKRLEYSTNGGLTWITYGLHNSIEGEITDIFCSGKDILVTCEDSENIYEYCGINGTSWVRRKKTQKIDKTKSIDKSSSSFQFNNKPELPVTSSVSKNASPLISFNSIEEETPQQKRERREREREERERQREEEERLEELARQEEARRAEEERMTCPYCGNKVKEGFYINFHGSNFHFECKEKFEKTSEGKNWIEKKLAEEKELELQIEKERKIEEQELEKDKKWILTTKAGKEQAAKIRDISDEKQKWESIRKARLEYKKYKEEVEDWGDETELGRKALSECKETDEDLRFQFLDRAYKAALETEKEEKEKLKRRKDKYSSVLEKLKSRIGDLTLFEKDGSRVNEFLETLENNFNDSNEAKLQKILNLNFQDSPEPKKGLIIAGIIMIISVSLSPIGIILLIIGLSKKKKAVKAMEKAAQYNFNLLKEIMYDNLPRELENEASETPTTDKAIEYCSNFIKRELDSDTAEKILLEDSEENEIKKAIENFTICTDEKILFGYDDTIKKSFKSGFVLTEKKLYFTDGNSFNKNLNVLVSDINSITFKKKLGVAYICVNDSCISITSPIEKDSEKLCEMLNRVVLILQKKGL